MVEKKKEMSMEKVGEPAASTSGRESYEDVGQKIGEKFTRTHGHEFYEDIGHKIGQKGGKRARELIEEGKEAEKR